MKERNKIKIPKANSADNSCYNAVILDLFIIFLF